MTRNFCGTTLEEATATADKYIKDWMLHQQAVIEGHFKKNDIYFVTVRYTSLD